MSNFIPINRCIAINKNNKKCRAKTKDNTLFCCQSHQPYNNDLLESCCFICQEEVKNPNEILYLKCRHAFHKPCYIEWLEYSTYDEPICLLCRTVVFKNQREEKKKRILENSTNIEPLIKISELLK